MDDATHIPQAIDNPYEAPPTSMAERRRRRALYMRDLGAAHVRVRNHVYFIEGGGLLKIGSAFDVSLRLRQLRDGSPVPLRLVGWVPNGGEALERKLHRALKARRRHGEWFAITWTEVKAVWKEIAK